MSESRWVEAHSVLTPTPQLRLRASAEAPDAATRRQLLRVAAATRFDPSSSSADVAAPRVCGRPSPARAAQHTGTAFPSSVAHRICVAPA